jgi:periplasmic copper chaperone A
VTKSLKPLIVVSLLLACAAVLLPSWALAQTGALTVQGAWLRKPPGVDTAAVYFVLKNAGTKPITVVGVSSPLADHVMIHESSMVEGQSRMRMRDKIVVAPGKSVAFAPEGLHVMLTGFTKDVAVGDKVPLTLQLEDGAQLSMTAVVRPLDAK